MKKLFLLLFTGMLFGSLSAQEVNYDELSLYIKGELNKENLEFNDEQSQESFQENTIEYYYKGKRRNAAVDTIYCYRWNVPEEEWENHHRSIKAFDNNDNLIEQTIQVWASDSLWINGLHYLYEYNSIGKRANKTVQVWNRHSNSWQNYFHKEFTYNSQGYLIEILNQKWCYQASEWANKYRKLLVYNNLNKLSVDTCQVWKPFHQKWCNSKLDLYKYNNTNSLHAKITKRRRLFPYAPWIKFSRVTFLYNSNNLMAFNKYQRWNPKKNKWINKKRNLFTYNNNAQLIGRLNQIWIPRINIWINNNRIGCSYNDSGYISERIYQKWDKRNSLWKNALLANFDYDNSGNLIEKLVQRWNPTAQSWINYLKFIVKIQYKSSPSDISEITNNNENIKLIFQNPYTNNSPIVVYGLKQGVYYTKVYDLNGKQIINMQCRDGETISFNKNLRPGIYIIYIQDDESIIYKKKMIVLK